jgi:hypothetical protein
MSDKITAFKLSCITLTVMVVKSKGIEWTGRVARMGIQKFIQNYLVYPIRKKLTVGSINLKESVCEGAQNRNQWRSLV